jgi:hypothetical protein
VEKCALRIFPHNTYTKRAPQVRANDCVDEDLPD